MTRASLDGVAILLTDNTQASCDMPCFTWTHIVGYDCENQTSPYYVHCYPFWESELISTRQKTIIERREVVSLYWYSSRVVGHGSRTTDRRTDGQTVCRWRGSRGPRTLVPPRSALPAAPTRDCHDHHVYIFFLPCCCCFLFISGELRD